MGQCGSWRFAVAPGGGVAALIWAGLACAQPAPPASTTHYLATMPYAAGAGDPFDLTVAPVQNGPAGTVSVTPTAPPSDYSFAEFTRNIHGYVSAGIATQGGHSFDGAVVIPLVPGKVDLSVGGASGQIGGFVPNAPGQKPGIAHYDAYNVLLHVHPTDDLDAYIGVTGGSYRLPYAQPWRVAGANPFGPFGP